MQLKTKLNIGAGKTRKPGFISVDAYNKKADIVAPAHNTGYYQESVDEIFSSHMIEHIDRAQLNIVISHWYEILKKGGSVTVLVPNAYIYLKEWIDNYDVGNFGHLEDWGTRWIMGFEGKGVGMYHTNLFCKETLIRLFERNKFLVSKCEETETRIKNKHHFEYRQNGDLLCIAVK